MAPERERRPAAAARRAAAHTAEALDVVSSTESGHATARRTTFHVSLPFTQP